MKEVNATLTGRKLINGHLGVFTFKLAKPISFVPGEFTGLSVITKDGKKITRSYSISSLPKNDSEIEFFIRWVKKGGKRDDGEGQLTHELFSPQPDTLKFTVRDKGMGHLKLKKSEKRNAVLICTGTGLAPFMSKLRLWAKQKKDCKGSLLIHGIANCSDEAYKEELQSIQEKTGIKVIHVESREKCTESEEEFDYVSEFLFNRDEKKEGRVSHEEIEAAINEHKLENPPINNYLSKKFSPKNHVVMLCGNPGMVDNVTTLLEGQGFALEKDIIAEKYWV